MQSKIEEIGKSRDSRNSRNLREGIDRSYSMLVIIHYKYEAQVGVGEAAGGRGRRKEGERGGRRERLINLMLKRWRQPTVYLLAHSVIGSNSPTNLVQISVRESEERRQGGRG